MLKAIKIKSANGVEKYLTEGKEHYYSEGMEEKGVWIGGEAFGFTGEVKQGDLKNLLEGRNQDGVLKGQVHEKRQAGWDCTFSAPKSVSVVWAFSGEEERKNLEQAHDKAVITALNYLKIYTLDKAVRRGKGGLQKEAVKEIPIAVYKHFTSRENDMQIHSHAILPNLALRQDGTFGGIQPDQVFKRMQEIGSIYQSALGENLKQLRYSIENDKQSIKLSNVPKELEQLFSKRSKIIDDRVELENATTSKHKDAIKLITRKNKTHTTPEKLKDVWLKEFHENNYKIEQIRELKNKNQENLKESSLEEKEKLKSKIIDKFVKNMSNTRSTFNENDLMREIAAQSRADFSPNEIISIMEEAKKSKEVIEIGKNRYTTQEIYDTERALLEDITILKNNISHSCTKASLEYCLVTPKDGKFLSDEQINMVKYVVDNRQIKIIQGLPGSGKSFAIARACEVFSDNGYTVRGLAPTGKAAENLEELNIKSSTVDKFLHDFNLGRDKFSARDVIVLDEAGMIGSLKTAKIIHHVLDSGAKVIFVGDSKQLQPLDAGGAFRLVQNEVGYIELTDIRRQNEEWYREAILDIRNGNVEKALHSYLEHEKIKVLDSQENMIENITKKYMIERLEDREKSQLVLCGTNYQVQKVNDSIRSLLKEQGALKNENSFTIEVKNRNNERFKKEFCVDDRIYFLQNSNKINVKNGSLGQIQKITKNKQNEVILDVKLDNKKKIKVNTSEYNKIDHGYACTVHKSQGSTADKVHVAIDRMDNEMAGVALSRHRESAIIYTNKENHGEFINSREIKQDPTNTLSHDFKIALESMNHSMTKSNQKETTIDYQTKELTTQWHINKSIELLMEKDNIRKYEILKDIGLNNLGVENPFLQAQEGFSFINKEALKIIERGEFKKEEIEKLCKHIESCPLGERSLMNRTELINARLEKVKGFLEEIEERMKPKIEIKVEKTLEVRSRTRERERSIGMSIGR